jgi:hypothetical protein
MATVFFRGSAVTVPDASFQLRDILDAFQQSDVGGYIRRRGVDAHIVATLPFESLPSFEVSDEYELVTPSSSGQMTNGGSASSGGNEEELMVSSLQGTDAATLAAQLLSSSDATLHSPETLAALTELLKTNATTSSSSNGCAEDNSAAGEYCAAVARELYVPVAFPQASYSVYAPSVYDPRRTAVTSFQQRAALSSPHYFAAIDSYQSIKQ